MPADKRHIAVFTGTRAEYGLLRPLMTLLRDDDDIELLTIVTGTHLEASHGRTVAELIEDGFRPTVEIPLGLDEGASVEDAAAACLVGVCGALTRLGPDVFVILGDRYEAMAAAFAATIINVPVAHIHGGELSEGAIDDSFRHAITKMAHLHFVAAPAYKNRVMQLGEPPERVFLVGALGIDTIKSMEFESKEWLEREIGCDLGEQYFLLTYHPVTRGETDQSGAVQALVHALDRFPDHKVLLTGTNADPGSDVVSRMLDDYASGSPDRVIARTSLGQKKYLTAMKWCDAVIGNSSSGIIEAPALAVPTVNIGPRQDGRQMAASIISCRAETAAIAAAISAALERRDDAPGSAASSVHGDGTAAQAILDVLKSVDPSDLARKTFYDLPYPSQGDA